MDNTPETKDHSLLLISETAVESNWGGRRAPRRARVSAERLAALATAAADALKAQQQHPSRRSRSRAAPRAAAGGCTSWSDCVATTGRLPVDAVTAFATRRRRRGAARAQRAQPPPTPPSLAGAGQPGKVSVHKLLKLAARSSRTLRSPRGCSSRVSATALRERGRRAAASAACRRGAAGGALAGQRYADGVPQLNFMRLGPASARGVVRRAAEAERLQRRRAGAAGERDGRRRHRYRCSARSGLLASPSPSTAASCRRSNPWTAPSWAGHARHHSFLRRALLARAALSAQEESPGP